MIILSTQFEDGRPVPQKTIKEDTPEIERIHNTTLKTEPLWDLFGGVITIENRKYQVFP